MVLPDGRLGSGNSVFSAPSDAATQLSGHRTNGWQFFRVGGADGPLLKSLRRQYIEQMAMEAEEEDLDDDGEEQEED